MKSLQYVFIAGLMFLINSCGSKAITSSSQSVKDDKNIRFIFLQVNDVYEIAAIDGGRIGGMARVETLHKELLKENENTFLFMAGDFLNPSLLGTLKYQGVPIRGRQMVEVMNAMNFDLVTFGNHEFDLNKNDLQLRLNEANFKFTSANVRQKIAGEPFPFYKEQEGIKNFVSDTYVLPITDKDGTTVIIGFFGVTLDANPQNYVVYSDFEQSAIRAYNSLKLRSDLVVGLTHLSMQQDSIVAKNLPDLALIMGGHEHNNQGLELGKVKIFKADANAKSAYIHRFNYNTQTRDLRIMSELVLLDSTIIPDRKIDSLVNGWNKILKDQIMELIPNPDEIIYTTKEALDGKDASVRSKQTNLGQLITRAMAYGYDNKVVCALVNGGSIRLDDELSGSINGVDIFRVLPFGGSILKVKLKGSLLKQVLNFAEESRGTGAYLQRYLVDLDIHGNWIINGQTIIDEQVYDVAMSDFLLKGYDIPFLNTKNKEVLQIYSPTKDNLTYDIRKTIIAYLGSLD